MKSSAARIPLSTSGIAAIAQVGTLALRFPAKQSSAAPAAASVLGATP